MASSESFSSNLGLAQVPETLDPKFFNELYKVYNAIHILARNLDSYTGILPRPSTDWSQLSPEDTLLVSGTQRLYLPFSEAIGYGQMVNIHSSAGNPAARKASATDTTKPCVAFCSVVAGVAAGAYGEIIFGGLLPIVGATIGTTYFLATVAGTVTATKPVTTGNLQQAVAFAIATNYLFFNPSLQTDVAP